MVYSNLFKGSLFMKMVRRCWRITDAGIAQLSVPDARTTETLVKLDLSSCVSLTNQVGISIVIF